jgi:hypothetical protein
MSAQSKGSTKQTSQKDSPSNPDTSTRGRSKFLVAVESPVGSAAEHEGKGNNSTPRYVWTSCENANHPTTGNK